MSGSQPADFQRPLPVADVARRRRQLLQEEPHRPLVALPQAPHLLVHRPLLREVQHPQRRRRRLTRT
jgi:hypothetical protein